MSAGIRINVIDGEYYVAAKTPKSLNAYKPDSMYHDGAKAIAKAAEILGINMNTAPPKTEFRETLSDRERRIVSFALWMYINAAHQKANESAQEGTGHADAFLADAQDAERIRNSLYESTRP